MLLEYILDIKLKNTQDVVSDWERFKNTEHLTHKFGRTSTILRELSNETLQACAWSHSPLPGLQLKIAIKFISTRLWKRFQYEPEEWLHRRVWKFHSLLAFRVPKVVRAVIEMFIIFFFQYFSISLKLKYF